MSAAHFLRVTDDNGDEQFVPQKTNGVVTGNGCYTIYRNGVELWSGSGLEAVQLLASLIRGPMAPRKISLDDELEEKTPNDAANVAGG